MALCSPRRSHKLEESWVGPHNYKFSVPVDIMNATVALVLCPTEAFERTIDVAAVGVDFGQNVCVVSSVFWRKHLGRYAFGRTPGQYIRV